MNYDLPHRRYNALTGEWLLVSPHRARRPWQGQVEKIPPEDIPAYDPTCYLCPGNARVGGIKNPVYASTYVFNNDFPALLRPEQMPTGQVEPQGPLFQALPETGICRVGCFSPRHDLTLPELEPAQAREVVCMWQAQTAELGTIDDIAYVQVFENKGALMGCSNPHPHNQIWATSRLPVEAEKELRTQTSHMTEYKECLLCDYVRAEIEKDVRIVVSNAHFTALVPFWAVWPFEILVIANRHSASLLDLSEAEVTGLAGILQQVTVRYDNLFEISFPYSMGFHQAPCKGGPYPAWHLHAHFYPPLLRSATVRKFMVGFEMLGMPQRDLTPETAASRLRMLNEIHYRHA